MIDQKIPKLLLYLAFVVIFMMFVGAVTRLTGSGLSIPEWPLINGSLLYPFSDADWETVFKIYQSYPQFHLINADMSLSEFKYIFFFEYFHRSITTLVSFFLFAILFFSIRSKAFWKEHRLFLLSILALLLLQAFAGYYMVKSGLEANKASVSQYRLAIHLLLATVFLGLILWTRWRIKYPKQSNKRVLSKSVVLFPLLMLLQLLSGAFMAGTDAGYYFNDWPLMNGELIPNIFANTAQYESNIFLNFTENIANIHFFHRLFAYVLTILLLRYYFFLKSEKKLKKNVYKLLPFILLLQVSLGILTLLFHMPIALAAFHQLGAILLFIQVLYISYHRLIQENH